MNTSRGDASNPPAGWLIVFCCFVRIHFNSNYNTLSAVGKGNINFFLQICVFEPKTTKKLSIYFIFY